MDSHTIGLIAGGIAAAAFLALGWAVIAWGVGVAGDCCPHEAGADA